MQPTTSVGVIDIDDILPIFVSGTNVTRLLGFKSPKQLYDVLKTDPTFPQRVQITPKRTAWLLAEVETWIANRPRTANQVNPRRSQHIRDIRAKTLRKARTSL